MFTSVGCEDDGSASPILEFVLAEIEPKDTATARPARHIVGVFQWNHKLTGLPEKRTDGAPTIDQALQILFSDWVLGTGY